VARNRADRVRYPQSAGKLVGEMANQIPEETVSSPAAKSWIAERKTQPPCDPVPIDPVVCGDMFWDHYDPEQCENDPDEILRVCYGTATVAHFRQAVRQPDFFGFYLESTDESGEVIDEEQFHYFRTKEEAEAALKTLTTSTPAVG
jgi:hypothetical protein